MPMIRVEMFAGRSDDQKRALAKELTDAFIRTAGGNPDAVEVMIVDVEKDSWAKGGVLFSDRG
ncbi:2-hydroxymuconate tautomerase [Roseovarius sp. 2305UL8-3]|uniref:2-hydroxymuconate tautomerase n=1 Tax=Roseovarius conchicola TaxID=3121636 RepID=UPI003527A5EA